MEKNNEKKFIEEKFGKANISEETLIKERKEKFIRFLKKRYNWITYIVLALIVFLAVKIRTLPMKIDPSTGKPRLWDITTDTWTLGPDLDPFLFLRWAEYIVEHGKLFATDMMRYVPLGYDTKGDLLLHPYLMAWFHKIAVLFGSESVTYSAVIYPVVMFALTIIAFFLFVRKVFIDNMGEHNADMVALIASFFLTVLPVFLPRTIAGIPEKESVAFLFMFLSFYLFLCAWKAKSLNVKLLFSVLAGISTAAMALIWGGYIYLLLTISSSIFIAFILGNVDKKRFYSYITWIITYSIIMISYSTRYHLSSLLTRGPVVVAFIILIHFIIFNTKLKRYTESRKLSKWPSHLVSIVSGLLILVIIAMSVFGLNFVFNYAKNIIQNLIIPVNTRFILTVAENKSPFFNEWIGNFGPYVRGVPIYFWLFFLGSIFLFYSIINIFPKKDRLYLTSAYIFLLLAITFDKYSSDSIFNGTSNISLIFYALGFIIFMSSSAFYYYKYYKKGNVDKLSSIDFGLISILVFFLLTLLSLRGGIRLVMVLAPSGSIIVAYFAVASLNYAMRIKKDILKKTAWVISAIIVLSLAFSGWQFYNEISSEAAVYAPSVYTQQWQKAMEWVRENTPANAVFGHWWDYGYWLQSIGMRATVLDGGNSQGYWNHMMGRYALTGSDNREALEFLYAHNTTHFLIDSTDIGKYSAFSSIGSDINYDRASWISTFTRDNDQVQETKNSTIYVYTGGAPLDEDIKYEENESRIFLPKGKAGLGAILIEQNTNGEVNTPAGIFVYQDKQYKIPLRYAFANGNLHDFGSGLEAGVFLFTKINQDGQQVNIEKNGALLYLSKKTVKSQLARLYLYKENDPYFKLVHSEDDAAVTWLKTQNAEVGDIVLFNGIRGPIRIWEINYPTDIEFKEKYLSTSYPKELEKVT